jgi:hypothetical protein
MKLHCYENLRCGADGGRILVIYLGSLCSQLTCWDSPSRAAVWTHEYTWCPTLLHFISSYRSHISHLSSLDAVFTWRRCGTTNAFLVTARFNKTKCKLISLILLALFNSFTCFPFHLSSGSYFLPFFILIFLYLLAFTLPYAFFTVTSLLSYFTWCVFPFSFSSFILSSFHLYLSNTSVPFTARIKLLNKPA